MATKSILNKGSLTFLEKYLNNAAPTGYEWEGQKIWMDYLKPYVDTFITDTYGSAVGVINPDAKYKVVIEGGTINNNAPIIPRPNVKNHIRVVFSTAHFSYI